MVIMCGMQLFWFCWAQWELLGSPTSVLLPTGACSGRRLALFPCHLSLLGDSGENLYFMKTAVFAIKALFIWVSGLQLILLPLKAIRMVPRRINATNVITFSALRKRLFILKVFSLVPGPQIKLFFLLVCCAQNLKDIDQNNQPSTSETSPVKQYLIIITIS